MNDNTWNLLPLVYRRSLDMVRECAEKNVPIRIIEGFRSKERQDELYAQGRTKPGPIITYARGGYSFHNYGVAFDIILFGHSNWDHVAEIGKTIGFEWGGDFSNIIDKPHFEMKLGYKIQDFLNNVVDYTKWS